MDSNVKEICNRLLDVPAPRLRPSEEMVDLARRVRRRRHARFAAAGAGLAVVAVTATATAVPLVDGSGTAADSGSSPVAASTAPAVPSPSPQLSRDLGREVRAVEVSTVVAEMVATAAGVRPLTIPDGQLLYLRTDERHAPAAGATKGPRERVGVPDGRIHEMWLDPQGMIALRVDVDGEDTSNQPKSNEDAEVEAARQQFAQEGPSLRMPSPQWLATLPTNAAALLRKVDAANAGTKLGGKHYEFKEISELFWRCGAVLTPPVRAAFYRALGRVSGVTATEVSVDGRRWYALRQPDNGRGFAQELLLDPATGRVVGERSLELTPKPVPVGLSLWHYAVVGSAGERG